MAGIMYFVQECPTCGRRVQVRVSYLGKRIACRHCGAQFAACDPQSPEYLLLDSSLTLLTRADQLLEASASRVTLPSSGF
jgi:recombinational DNA repair protein (RecF pathway)